MKKVHKGLVVAVSGFITMILAAGGAWAQSSTPSSSGADSRRADDLHRGHDQRHAHGQPVEGDRVA